MARRIPRPRVRGGSRLPPGLLTADLPESVRPGQGREQGHAAGQMAPDRPDADAHRLGGLHVGRAHVLAKRDGLPLADWKGAQRGGSGFPVQVADGRTPGTRRIRRNGWRDAVARGLASAYRPRSAHDFPAQVHTRRAGVSRAGPCVLRGGERIPHDGSGRGGITV